jgi:hypothetical protein
MVASWRLRHSSEPKIWTDAFVDESIRGQRYELPIESLVVICRRRQRVTEFEARSRCLACIVAALQLRSVDRLVIESRQDDVDDERTIHRERQRESRLVFEHRRGTDEPLLWIPDGVAWAVGAGPRWSEILGTGVSRIIDV